MNRHHHAPVRRPEKPRGHHPEFRQPGDPIAQAGRGLRERQAELQPHSDTKHWR